MIKNSEVLQMKNELNPEQLLGDKVPELIPIWKYITSLGFEDKPQYQEIYSLFQQAFKRLNIELSDSYDWLIPLQNTRHYLAQQFSTENHQVSQFSKIDTVFQEDLINTFSLISESNKKHFCNCNNDEFNTD